MIEARRRASTQAVARAERALKDMVRAGEPITISAVAARAKVSRGWLSRHPDLAPKVRNQRQLPIAATNYDPAVPREPAGSPLAALREHLRREEQRHQNELAVTRARIHDLERQLQAALGEVIRLRKSIR